MRSHYRSWVMAALLGSAAGCAGNGEGLDQNGQPIGSGGSSGGGSSGPVTADFQSIQDNVFTPICSKCHIGASAPEGLQLDAGHSYNLLVGVPSAEKPSLLRVNPGNPDASYMVLKIEGASGIVGGQMPLGETPLPQTTINAIRQWITNGAPNTSAASPSAATPSAASPSAASLHAANTSAVSAQMFAVQSTAPSDSGVVKAPLRQIIVAFSQEVDASLVNDTTVSLERIGESDVGAQAAAYGGVQRVSIAAALAEHNPAVLLITPRAPLDAGVYRATLRGSGGGALANLNATTLGADLSFEFTVETAP
jgi:hypothetical protein